VGKSQGGRGRKVHLFDRSERGRGAVRTWEKETEDHGES